jgi:hypothetical protein
MARPRLLRRATAFVVVLSLLFAQLALAAYACPGEQDEQAMAERMAAGMPCEGMDPGQPALCHEHAIGAPQSVTAGELAAPTLPMIVQVLFLSPQLRIAQTGLAPGVGEPEPRPPPDPLFLSTLRLRV